MKSETTLTKLFMRFCKWNNYFTQWRLTTHQCLNSNWTSERCSIIFYLCLRLHRCKQLSQWLVSFWWHLFLSVFLSFVTQTTVCTAADNFCFWIWRVKTNNVKTHIMLMSVNISLHVSINFFPFFLPELTQINKLNRFFYHLWTKKKGIVNSIKVPSPQWTFHFVYYVWNSFGCRSRDCKFIERGRRLCPDRQSLSALLFMSLLIDSLKWNTTF